MPDSPPVPLERPDPVSRRLLEARIVVLGGPIDDAMANLVCSQLLVLEADDPGRDLTLYINSPGGSVDAGFAIYDTMRLLGCDVATVSMGLSASMGQFLLCAGTPGKRYALRHSRILMHQPLGQLSGVATDIVVHADQFAHLRRLMAERIAFHTGQPVERVTADFDRDRWFTAEEALAYGMVDAVVDHRSQLPASLPAPSDAGPGGADSAGDPPPVTAGPRSLIPREPDGSVGSMGRTATIDGRTVHYLDEGGGEPVLLLAHGFPLRAEMWEPQVDAFAGRHRVVAPDLFGFGGSDVPADKTEYSIDGYADQIAALARELGIARFVLIGLSMGGYIALALARRHPQLLAGLVLADTRAEADSDEARRKRDEQQVLLGAGGGVDSLAEPLLDALLSKRSPGREEVAERAGEWMRTTDPKGWIGALEAMKQRGDATSALPAISVPTLVIVGEDDEITPPSAAEAMAGAIPGARLVVVPAAGHLSNLENPEAFNVALGEFVSVL